MRLLTNGGKDVKKRYGGEQVHVPAVETVEVSQKNKQTSKYLQHMIYPAIITQETQKQVWHRDIYIYRTIVKICVMEPIYKSINNEMVEESEILLRHKMNKCIITYRRIGVTGNYIK
jgi:ribosomal protein L13